MLPGLSATEHFVFGNHSYARKDMGQSVNIYFGKLQLFGRNTHTFHAGGNGQNGVARTTVEFWMVFCLSFWVQETTPGCWFFATRKNNPDL